MSEEHIGLCVQEGLCAREKAGGGGREPTRVRCMSASMSSVILFTLVSFLHPRTFNPEESVYRPGEGWPCLRLTALGEALLLLLPLKSPISASRADLCL